MRRPSISSSPLALAPLALLAALASPSPAAAVPAPVMACNGSVELCDRPYDEVSYATTHNAFNAFVDPVDYHFVNQGFDIPTQLVDGVRALMIDVHEYNGQDSAHDGEIWVCHSLCALGGEPLVDVLVDIREFLDANPQEVVSIIFESYVSKAEVKAAFEDAGLLRYAFAQPDGAPWPTLGTLVASDQRLLVFTDREGGTTDWYMDVWAYAVETHYSVKHKEDFTCDFNRGDPRNDLFIFNHFLTYPLARRSLAYQVNFNPFLIDRANQCWQETGLRPTFVTVDFYNIGDALDAVDELNGVP